MMVEVVRKLNNGLALERKPRCPETIQRKTYNMALKKSCLECTNVELKSLSGQELLDIFLSQIVPIANKLWLWDRTSDCEKELMREESRELYSNCARVRDCVLKCLYEKLAKVEMPKPGMGAFIRGGTFTVVGRSEKNGFWWLTTEAKTVRGQFIQIEIPESEVLEGIKAFRAEEAARSFAREESVFKEVFKTRFLPKKVDTDDLNERPKDTHR